MRAAWLLACVCRWWRKGVSESVVSFVFQELEKKNAMSVPRDWYPPSDLARAAPKSAAAAATVMLEGGFRAPANTKQRFHELASSKASELRPSLKARGLALRLAGEDERVTEVHVRVARLLLSKVHV